MKCIIVTPLTKEVRKKLVEAYVHSMVEQDESFHMFWEEIKLLMMMYDDILLSFQYYINSTHFSRDVMNEMVSMGINDLNRGLRLKAIFSEALSLN